MNRTFNENMILKIYISYNEAFIQRNIYCRDTSEFLERH